MALDSDLRYLIGQDIHALLKNLERIDRNGHKKGFPEASDVDLVNAVEALERVFIGLSDCDTPLRHPDLPQEYQNGRVTREQVLNERKEYAESFKEDQDESEPA